MKTTIRPQSFETNSSSVHAIVFSKDYDMSQASSIHYVDGGSYGWEFLTYSTPEDKLAYLWTAIHNASYKDLLAVSAWKEYLCQELNLPEDVEFNDLFDTSDRYYLGYYVDHSEGLDSLLNSMLEDPEILRAFVFGNGTIETGNDNENWPEDHMINAPEFQWRWNEETDEYIPPEIPCEKLGEWHGNWVYIKKN